MVRLCQEVFSCGGFYMMFTVYSWGGRLFLCLGKSSTSDGRCLSLGGEKMTPGLVAEWSTGSIQLRNIYGVTEATVYQTAMVMSPKTSPQIAGRPLPGGQIAWMDFCMLYVQKLWSIDIHWRKTEWCMILQEQTAPFSFSYICLWCRKPLDWVSQHLHQHHPSISWPHGIGPPHCRCPCLFGSLVCRWRWCDGWWGDLLGRSWNCQRLSESGNQCFPQRWEWEILFYRRCRSMVFGGFGGGWANPGEKIAGLGSKRSSGETEWRTDWAGWGWTFIELKSFGASMCCYPLGTRKSTCICGTSRWRDFRWCCLPLLNGALRQAFVTHHETSTFCRSGSLARDGQWKDWSKCLAQIAIGNRPYKWSFQAGTYKPGRSNCIGLGFWTFNTSKSGSWCEFLWLGWWKCASRQGHSNSTCCASWWWRWWKMDWRKKWLAKPSWGCITFSFTWQGWWCWMSLWFMWWWTFCSMCPIGTTTLEAICTFSFQCRCENIPKSKWRDWNWRSGTATSPGKCNSLQTGDLVSCAVSCWCLSNRRSYRKATWNNTFALGCHEMHRQFGRIAGVLWRQCHVTWILRTVIGFSMLFIVFWCSLFICCHTKGAEWDSKCRFVNNWFHQCLCICAKVCTSPKMDGIGFVSKSPTSCRLAHHRITWCS